MGESETGKGSHGSGSMKNIIILGVGFMLLLAAFLTMAAIEVSSKILKSTYIFLVSIFLTKSFTYLANGSSKRPVG